MYRKQKTEDHFTSLKVKEIDDPAEVQNIAEVNLVTPTLFEVFACVFEKEYECV